MALPPPRTKNKTLLEISKAIATIAIASGLSYGIVRAGSLSPSATPAATSYTLEDIYQRLTTGTTSAVAGGHDLSSSGSPTSATMHSLAEVYTAITESNFNAVNTQGPLNDDDENNTWIDANTGLMWGPVHNTATSNNPSTPVATTACAGNEDTLTPNGGWHIPSVDEWKTVMDVTQTPGFILPNTASVVNGGYYTSSFPPSGSLGAPYIAAIGIVYTNAGDGVGFIVSSNNNFSYVCVRDANGD